MGTERFRWEERTWAQMAWRDGKRRRSQMREERVQVKDHRDGAWMMSEKQRMWVKELKITAETKRAERAVVMEQ